MNTDSEKYFWFLNSLTTIRVSAQDGANQISVVEQRAPMGYSPPLHLHRAQDEIFHVLKGEFRLKVGDQEKRLKADDILLIPKGTPHSFRIESPEDGRWLAITVGTDYENFVRALARPAERLEIPSSDEDTSPDNVLTLTMTATQFGIDIVGPRLE
jgi:mannose-6-phosphate isomerase-like protein (cupin superfamily)